MFISHKTCINKSILFVKLFPEILKKMLKNSLLISLFISFTSLHAQELEVIKFPKMEELMSQKNDTTYVINFWATWCKPCVAEIPYFQQLEQEWKKEKVKFIYVSIDFIRRKPGVVNIINEKQWKGRFYLLDEPDQNAWIDKVSTEWEASIPATLVYNHKKNKKQFFEREFKYEELKKELNQFIK